MKSTRYRLDRFLSEQTGIKKSDIRPLVAQKRIQVDGKDADSRNQLIDQFTHIVFDGQVLQNNVPRYIMLYKPTGVVSATEDSEHKTALECLPPELRAELHIVGRLDLNSSGLLLLTNDGRWSRQLTSPESKVEKVYEVTVAKPISDECIVAFTKGIYFGFEGITTQSASLIRISKTQARVTLTEGRYHQIKRMFGRFRNPVLKLHRTAIGSLQLDTSLAPGEYRALTDQELEKLSPNNS